ncbi:hypothetical protein KCU83_g196, partial [Aureobasidium melanogenum]
MSNFQQAKSVVDRICQCPEQSMHPLLPPLFTKQPCQLFLVLELFGIEYLRGPLLRAKVEVWRCPWCKVVVETSVMAGIQFGKMMVPVCLGPFVSRSALALYSVCCWLLVLPVLHVLLVVMVGILLQRSDGAFVPLLHQETTSVLVFRTGRTGVSCMLAGGGGERLVVRVGGR